MEIHTEKKKKEEIKYYTYFDIVIFVPDSAMIRFSVPPPLPMVMRRGTKKGKKKEKKRYNNCMPSHSEDIYEERHSA